MGAKKQAELKPATFAGQAIPGWFEGEKDRIYRQTSDTVVLEAILDGALSEDYMPEINIHKMLFSHDGERLDLNEAITAMGEKANNRVKGAFTLYPGARFNVLEDEWVLPTLDVLATALGQYAEMISERKITFEGRETVIDEATYPIIIDESVPLLDRLCLLATADNREQDGWTEAELRAVLTARPAAEMCARSRRGIATSDASQFHVLSGFVNAANSKETFDFMSGIVYRLINGTDEGRPDILPSNPDPKFRTPLRELEKLSSVANLVERMRVEDADGDQWMRLLDRPFDALHRISVLPMIESTLQSSELTKLIFAMTSDDVNDMRAHSLWTKAGHAAWLNGSAGLLPDVKATEVVRETITPIIYRILDEDIASTVDALLCLPEKVWAAYYFRDEEVVDLEGWLETVWAYSGTDRTVAFPWYYNLTHGKA